MVGVPIKGTMVGVPDKNHTGLSPHGISEMSSLLTKSITKDLRSLVQWLGPTFPTDLVYIRAYLGCTQVCSGSSCTAPIDHTKGL